MFGVRLRLFSRECKSKSFSYLMWMDLFLNCPCMEELLGMLHNKISTTTSRIHSNSLKPSTLSLNTLISRYIITSCLILCRSPVCLQNSCDLSRHGLHETSEVSCDIGHQHVSSGSFKSFKLRGGVSMDQTCVSQMLIWIMVLDYLEVLPTT